MSDLADLAFDVAGDLPAQVRKVIDTATANGWELNKPGMTLALRLNHPADELAQPVYITWSVGRTASGRLSFRFMSCGTQGLISLSGADLLEYLADPTVIYTVAEEAEADYDAKAKPPPWDRDVSPEVNVMRQLGGSIIGVEPNRKPVVPKPQNLGVSRSANPTGRKTAGKTLPARPLRVQAPKV